MWMYPFYPVHNLSIVLHLDYTNIETLLKGQGPWEDKFSITYYMYKVCLSEQML